MKKIQHSILILAVAALVITPLFVSAQGSAVTKAQLDGMFQQEEALRRQRNEGIKLTPSDQAAAIQNCMTIGSTYNSITKGVYSTLWSTGTLSCSIGTVSQTQPTDEDWKHPGRSYTTLYDLGAQVYMQGLKDGNLKDQNGVVVTQVDAQFFSNTLKTAGGQDSGGETWISRLLGGIISGLGNILASLLAFFATLALYLLSICTDYTTTVLAPDIINRGWVIVRDFMNLFFIIALIVMALATILRQEAYNYRRLLFQLILMAILINFSKVIAETLINFSDMLIKLFSPANGIKSYGTVIYSGFVTQGDGIAGFFGNGVGAVPGLAGVVTKVGGLLVLTVVLVAISLLMFVRMVGLWFLVMVSPVAYALNILPGTKQYASMWWKTFTKYLIWGPVSMFFLRLSFVFINEQGNNLIDDHFLNYLFISAFVWAGFVMAKQAGMIGAAGVVSGAQSVLNKAKNYAKDGAKFSARAGGNYVWRGNMAGHVGGAAKWAQEGVFGSGFNKKTYTDARDKEKAEFGERTARVSNLPSLWKQKLIDNPNAARKKVVERQHRREIIRRDYLKDFDEDTAKKIKPDDLAFLFEPQNADKVNEAKLKNIIDHGTADTKMALAFAFREGKVQTNSNFDHSQRDEIFRQTREFAWKQRGFKMDELEKHPEFMSLTHTYDIKDASGAVIDTRPTIERDLQYTRKNKDFDIDPATGKPWVGNPTHNEHNSAVPFDKKLKSAYTKVDPDKNWYKDKTGVHLK